MPKIQELYFRVNTIRALPPAAPGKRDYYRDSKDLKIFLTLAVTDRGTKSFFVQRWIDGRPLRMTIGRFPDVSIDQARRTAAILNQDVAAGKNPYAETEPIRHGPTFGEFFEHEYIPRHAKPHKKTWDQDANLFRLHLHPIAHLKMASIERRDVTRLHVELGENVGKRTANLAVGLIRSVFRRAKESSFYTGSSPAEGIKKFPELSRERFLKPEEVPLFFAALTADAEAQGTNIWRDFFMLALFTGARRGNLMTMRWKDIDLVRATWTIPAESTKSGRTYVLALPSIALELLQSRRYEVPDDCPWVFPGSGRQGHIVEPKTAWERIRKRSGLHDLRIHDLRRTLGSWQAAAGASLPIIGRSLGHTTPSSTAIYARLDIDPVRESVEKATSALIAAGNMPRLEREK